MKWIKANDQFPAQEQECIYFYRYIGIFRGSFYNDGPEDYEKGFVNGEGSGFIHYQDCWWMPDEGQDLESIEYPESYEQL